MSPSPKREGRLLPVYTKANKRKTKEKSLSQELNLQKENPTLAQNVGYWGPEPSVVWLLKIKFSWENFISTGWGTGRPWRPSNCRVGEGPVPQSQRGKHRHWSNDCKPVQVMVVRVGGSFLVTLLRRGPERGGLGNTTTGWGVCPGG